MKIRMNKIIGALLLTLLLFAVNIPVFAADAGDIDWSREGSVTLSVKDGTSGEILSGAQIALLKVADGRSENGTIVYTPTADFSKFSFKDISDTSLPEELAAHVGSEEIALESVTVGTDGIAAFSDLRPGLYLVMQPPTDKSGAVISPFLLMLPEASGDEWVYEITGSPKAVSGSTVPTTPPETTTKTTPGPELPNTGQLNWPVPVLAVMGMACIVLGFFLIFMKKDRA